jgi:hypothetical protein
VHKRYFDLRVVEESKGARDGGCGVELLGPVGFEPDGVDESKSGVDGDGAFGDVLMVAYRNRDRLYDPSYAPLIHDRFGNATSVVLDKGRVVGQWDLGSHDSPLVIKVAPFSKWSKRLWDDVGEQAHRIARLIGAESVDVVPVAEPVDLLDSSRNRFLAPLSKR